RLQRRGPAGPADAAGVSPASRPGELRALQALRPPGLSRLPAAHVGGDAVRGLREGDLPAAGLHPAAQRDGRPHGRAHAVRHVHRDRPERAGLSRADAGPWDRRAAGYLRPVTCSADAVDLLHLVLPARRYPAPVAELVLAVDR